MAPTENPLFPNKLTPKTGARFPPFVPRVLLSVRAYQRGISHHVHGDEAGHGGAHAVLPRHVVGRADPHPLNGSETGVLQAKHSAVREILGTRHRYDLHGDFWQPTHWEGISS